MADLFIGGHWVAAADGGTREIRCPADGQPVRRVDEATSADTVRAVEAARESFDDGRWRSVPFTERAQFLERVADLLERDVDAIARAESLDTGKRLVEAEYDVADVVRSFRYFAGLAGGDAVGGRVVDAGNPQVRSRIDYEPVGVCGLITPWNYPLLQADRKSVV